MEQDDETQAQPMGTDFLKSLPYDVVLRAKHIVSHLLLPEGATVLDLECETGALTAAMAYLNPRLKFIGIDRNRQLILRARARFKATGLQNLGFEVGDSAALRRADDSVDAIVASRVIGEIYTRGNYDDTRVADVLARQFRVLKADGLLVIYDYAMPDADDYVQIEFPIPVRDQKYFRLHGTEIGVTQGEREIELLQWFSQNARARDAIKGFYLEELAPHVPFTRLFRLPAKWANEFIIRKIHIRKFKAHIGHLYTCLSESDFDRILSRVLGARIVYTAPWRNPHVIRTHYEGSFRLYTADGKPRGYPPAGHIVVAQKVQAGQSLRLEELRPSADETQSISIQALRDETSGELIDVVSRAVPRTDIIPYFISPTGRLKVVLRADADMGLANTIPRARRNLDGKRWSGHVVAAPTLSVFELEGFDHASQAALARLLAQKFGLKPEQGKTFENGPKGFPAPSLVDERLETLFINVQRPDFAKPRLASAPDALRLKVYDAEDVLRATGAGFVPSAWLDIQMQELMRAKGLKVTPWLHEAIPLSYEPPPSDQLLRAPKILRQKVKGPEKAAGPMHTIGANGKTKWPRVAGAFRPIRGRAGQVSAYRSSFVEQGRVDGAIRGMAAHDMEFACPQADMMNIAAIMPLTEDLQGNTLVGFEFKELPVPSRFGQDAPMMNLPTLPLPLSITTIDEARAYIAEQFDVEVARVAPMGESFFTFVDMIPQRVFPFALTRYPRRRNLRIRYTTLTHILDLTDTDFADSILWKWGFANALLCQESGQSQGFSVRVDANKRVFGKSTPAWSASSSWHKAKSDNDRKPTLPARRNRPNT